MTFDELYAIASETSARSREQSADRAILTIVEALMRVNSAAQDEMLDKIEARFKSSTVVPATEDR